jgi:hypothetical protein
MSAQIEGDPLTKRYGFDQLAVLTSGGPTFSDVATATSATIAVDVAICTLQAYDIGVDPFAGRARYRRVDTEPAHDLKFQSSDTGWWEIAETFITPEMAGHPADGTTPDDAALTRWTEGGNALGAILVTTQGKSYAASSAAALTIKTPINFTGAEFIWPNDGQSTALFTIDSLASDIETIDATTVNGWTNLFKGSRHIPELTERDWAYSFHSSDAVILARSSGTAINIGEAFATVSDDGWLDDPLERTYSAFTDLTCTRRKMRAPISITGLVVRVTNGTSLGANQVVKVLRPRTKLMNCHVWNEGDDNIQQGFVADDTVDVSYENCTVGGLESVSTEYAFNSNYCNRITYIDCSQSQCRRGQDGHASKNVRVIRGNFPDGTGGHWIDGLTMEGAELGYRSADNPACVQVAGSRVMALNCNFHMGLAGSAILMRGDMPEISGYCILRGGSVIIYDKNDEIGAGDIRVMYLGNFASYDSVRDVNLPSYVECTPDLVRQVGSTSTNKIELVYYGCPKTAAQFPRSVNVSGRMLIAPGKLDLEAGNDNAGTPRIAVTLYKGETQAGDGMDVTVRNVPRPYVFSGPISASVSGVNGRYNVLVEDASEVSKFELRYGATKMGRLRRCNPASAFGRTGLVAALGDEAIDFEDFGANHQGLLINPFGGIIQRGNGISVADGSYGPDGWIGVSESGNLTSSVVADVANGLPFVMRWLQPDVSSKRIGALSFIGSHESVALRDRLVSLAATIRSSAARTVRYAIGEWTGTANSPTRDVVNNWASGSFTPGGFFVSSNFNILTTGSIALSALTDTKIDPLYAHLGSSVTNLFVMFWTDTAVAQNGYIQIAADLAPGFARPLIRRRSLMEERLRCSEWFRSMTIALDTTNRHVTLSPQMTKSPAIAANPSTNVTISHQDANGYDIVMSSGTASPTVTIDASI